MAWIQLWARSFLAMYGLDGDVTKKMSVESLWNSRLIPAFQNIDYPSTLFIRLYIEYLSTNFEEEYYEYIQDKVYRYKSTPISE